jgi:hypothetical protein
MKLKKSMMKHLNASSYIKFFIIIIIISISIFSIFFKVGYAKVLTITHQETGEVFVKISVKPGDTLKYKWIHSFEHIPWTEEYEILENNSLLLHEITVAGFGAGIPENKGKVTIEDGTIIMSEIEENFEEINWINSNTALSYIGFNGEEIIKGSEIPHHEPLNLIIKEMLSIWPRFH